MVRYRWDAGPLEVVRNKQFPGPIIVARENYATIAGHIKPGNIHLGNGMKSMFADSGVAHLQ